MELVTDYIKIVNDALPENFLNNFHKHLQLKSKEFQTGTVAGNGQAGGVVDTSIRQVGIYPLTVCDGKLEDAYYYNLFSEYLFKIVEDYVEETGNYCQVRNLLNMQVLRYEKAGHYKFHVDASAFYPRTLSIIYLINDDYEGGELEFIKATKNSQEPIRIPKKKNTLVIWPSNFMYPHRVTPVTRGVRYSMVTWLL